MAEAEAPHTSGVVRIRTLQDGTAGVGVLVGRHAVVTCAHVVNAALGRPLRTQEPPDPRVCLRIDFPGVANAPVRECTVVAWTAPETAGLGGDIAGLQLREVAPAEAATATFDAQPAPAGARLRVFGYPEDPPRPKGVRIVVEVKDAAGPLTQQVDTVGGEAITAQPGFSGSPVWDDTAKLVEGLITGTAYPDQPGRDAYLIPPGQVARAWEEQLGYVNRPENPYPGLDPFTSAKSDVFFGRDDDAEQLAAMVRTKPVVAVVGASGVGKSSLVGAGLVAALCKQPENNDDDWTVVTVRPGADPWMALAAPLAEVLLGRTPNPGEIAEFAERLRSGGGLDAVARPLRVLHRPLLLVIDQFEELLADRASPPDPALLDLIVPRADAPDTGARIVITVRTDVLDAWPDSARLSREEIFLLRPLTEEQRREAVERPAALRNVRFEADLVAKIVQQTTDDSLPLLQFILREFWDTQHRGWLTHQRYDELGGVAGFLASFAEKQAAKLRSDSNQAAFDQALLDLVLAGRDAAGGCLFMRSRVERSSVADSEWEILQRLSEARLVNINTPTAGEPFAELAHERLITAWPRLEQLSAQYAEFLEWRAWIEQRERDGHGDLLSEQRIAEARRWLELAPSRITERVRGFVDRSRAAIDDQVRRLTEAFNRSEALRLAFEAELILRSARARPALALGLAIESGTIVSTTQGDMAVRRALATYRPAIGRLDHAGPVAAVACSPDGVRVVLIDEGGYVRSFDAETGRAGHGYLHAGPVTALALSGDGSRLATVSDERVVTVLDLATFAVVDEYVQPGVTIVALSRSGQYAVSGGRDGTIQVRDTQVAASSIVPIGAVVTCASFQSDGDLVAVGTRDGRMTVYDAAPGLMRRTIQHSTPVRTVRLSPNGEYVVSGCEDGTVSLLHVGSGETIRQAPHRGPVYDVCFDADGKTIASSGVDGFVAVLDVSSGVAGPRLEHDGPVPSICFGEVEGMLATGCADGSVRLFATASGALLARLEHDGPVRSIALGRRDSRLVVSLADGTTALYDTAPVGGELRRLEHPAQVATLAVGGAGTVLVVATEDGVVRTSDLDGTGFILDMPHGARVWGVAAARDADLVASAGADGVVRIWSARDPAPTAEFRHHGDLLAVCLSADGALVGTGGTAGTVAVTRINGNVNGSTVLTYRHDGAVGAIAMDPAATRIASAGSDKTVAIGDLVGNVAEVFLRLDEQCLAVAFSPDGTRLACATDKGAVHVYDVATKREMIKFDHDAPVRAICFAPDGNAIATGCADHAARVFDVRNGRLAGAFDFDGPVSGVAFDASGGVLIGGSFDKSVRCYETSSTALLERAKRAQPRDLTGDERRRFGLDRNRSSGAPAAVAGEGKGEIEP